MVHPALAQRIAISTGVMITLNPGFRGTTMRYVEYDLAPLREC